MGEEAVEVRGSFGVYHRRGEANLGQLHHQELDSKYSSKRRRRQGQAA